MGTAVLREGVWKFPLRPALPRRRLGFPGELRLHGATLLGPEFCSEEQTGVPSSAVRTTSQALALALLLSTGELPAPQAPVGLPRTLVHVGDTCAQEAFFATPLPPAICMRVACAESVSPTALSPRTAETSPPLDLAPG